MIRSQRIVIAAAAVVMLLFPLTAPAADPFIGNIRAIDSTDPGAVAKIVRPGYAGIIPGKPGDAIYTGDTVKSGEGVRLQLELSDKSVITVAPNSAVQMKGHLVDPEQGKRSMVMRALKGTVRFVIAKFFKPHAAGAEMKWKESNVTIEALNAVAGVRGTDVAVTSTGSESEIAVFEGTVSVRHASPARKGEAVIEAGQFTTVTKDRPPSPPSALSQERRDALEKATTLVNPRTTAEAPQGPEPKKKQCDGKDVEKDLVAGAPLGDVVDKFVACGLPLAGVIAAALDAGVDPFTLVYTAVTEGYSAKEVVTAALDQEAPLAVVVAAAIGAGADKNMVISGAIDAGVPPAAIATAIAAAMSSTAPVYGGIVPMDSSPASIIPAPPASIGGGGGGTPSTQPASPYKP
jgi:hypothetical protein